MSWIKSVAHEDNSKVLVFTETKRGADSLCRELQYQSLPANAIHGDKEQRQRDKTLHDFRTGRCNILIATDVAQRGLDIKDVAFVAGWYCANIFIVFLGLAGSATPKPDKRRFTCNIMQLTCNPYDSIVNSKDFQPVFLQISPLTPILHLVKIQRVDDQLPIFGGK